MKHKLLFIFAFSALYILSQASVELNSAPGSDFVQREYIQLNDVADELAPEKDSGELNETEILLLKMYGKEKKKVEKTPEEVYLEEKKKEEDIQLNDETLMKIVFGVFFFTIFLWFLSKYFEWKYRKENAGLGEEVDKMEKEYNAKYAEYTRKKNKKKN